MLRVGTKRALVFAMLKNTLIFIVGIASTASAQQNPYPDSPPPGTITERPKNNYPGTDNPSPENTSTMNGQLVPVGERNQYVYNYPKTNISINPIGVIYGMYGVSASHALNMNVAIRADLAFFDNDFGSNVSFTAAAPIYFRKVYSGFYLEPGIKIGSIFHDDFKGAVVNVGWHWIWDSGFNVSIAGGAARGLSNREEEIVPTGYFRTGFAF